MNLDIYQKPNRSLKEEDPKCIDALPFLGIKSSSQEEGILSALGEEALPNTSSSGGGAPLISKKLADSLKKKLGIIK